MKREPSNKLNQTFVFDKTEVDIDKDVKRQKEDTPYYRALKNKIIPRLYGLFGMY